MCRGLAIAVTLVTTHFCTQMTSSYVECSCFLLIVFRRIILVLLTSQLVMITLQFVLPHILFLFPCKISAEICANSGCQTLAN